MDNKAYIYSMIYTLSNRLQKIGDKIDSETSTKQWFILAVVSKFNDKAPNIGEVANILGTSRQNIKKLANILEEKGFLVLEKSKKDMRNIELFLTDKCYEYFEGRRQKENEYIEKLFDGIDEKTLNIISSSIKKLIENTEAIEKNEER